jgi:hypothetical protein
LSSIFSTLKFLATVSVFDSILNRNFLLNSFERLIPENLFKAALLEKSYALDGDLLKKLNNLNIDEI